LKIIEKILYIEFADFINAGWNENTIKSANLRNGAFWMMIKNPSDKRMTLVQFDTLRQKDKDKLTVQFGNPYEYLGKAPIKQLVQPDLNAESFYTAFRYNGTSALPIETVQAYTKAASWLNMIIKCNEDKKFIKKELNLPLVTFYENVKSIIDADGITLPSSYKRLREKMKEYQENGFGCLIDWRFGNSNGVKVNDEVAEAILFEMIAHPKQFDDVYISWQYNAWAKTNERKEITSGTVGNYRRRYYDLLIIQREGNESYVNTYGKSIKGIRPSQPTYFIESDDNHTDYYFVNWDDKTSHKYYYTFKCMVVTDSFNDLVLGYAVGTEITVDLVKEAYRNAMYYMRKLSGTNTWYLPHETKTDRWGLKALQPFYESMGNYAATPKGSKKRGYLEQFFGSTHWERAIKLCGKNNYNGHNVTAKTKGVNREVLEASKKDYPTVQEAPQYFADFYNRLRLMPPKEGAISKEQQWKDAFALMPADKKRCITDEDFLLKFGILRDEKNTITDRGIDLSINNSKYNFDIPDEYYYKHKGLTLRTIYDPNDMSRVLVTDLKSIRFIASAPHYQSRAMADYQEGDRTRLNVHLAAKKAHVQLISTKQEERQNVLTTGGIDVSKMLTEGFLLKEQRQATQQIYEKELRHLKEPERNHSRTHDAASKM